VDNHIEILYEMWIIIGNMGVLPEGLLYFAVPLSLLETFFAVYIIKIFTK